MSSIEWSAASTRASGPASSAQYVDSPPVVVTMTHVAGWPAIVSVLARVGPARSSVSRRSLAAALAA